MGMIVSWALDLPHVGNSKTNVRRIQLFTADHSMYAPDIVSGRHIKRSIMNNQHAYADNARPASLVQRRHHVVNMCTCMQWNDIGNACMNEPQLLERVPTTN